MNGFQAIKDSSAHHEVPVGLKPQIRTIKERVSLAEYAAALTKLRRSGATLRGRCPACGGSPHSGALCIYQPDAPAQEQYFVCYRCGEKGDVISLYMVAEGGAVWEAVVGLSIKFGIELPKRPPKWHAWQKTKSEIRDAAEEARKVVRRERLFKYLVLTGPEFEIEDDTERQRSIEKAWRVWDAEMRKIGQ